jgi:hypothetical protein
LNIDFYITLSIIPTSSLAKDESINVLKEDFIYKYSGVGFVKKQ